MRILDIIFVVFCLVSIFWLVVFFKPRPEPDKIVLEVPVIANAPNTVRLHCEEVEW